MPEALPPLSAPRLLLVGAGGRHAGKTEFVCAVIRALRAGGAAVAAAKATTVREEQAARHGGQALPPEGFSITEQAPGKDPSSDTGRMLAAGAGRAYRLVTTRPALRAAAEALLGRVEPGEWLVCESNSLRLVVEPGCFVIVEREGQALRGKPSLEEVRRFPYEPVRLPEGGAGRDEAAARLASAMSSTASGAPDGHAQPRDDQESA